MKSALPNYSAFDDVSLLKLYRNGDDNACAAIISRYAALINSLSKGKIVHGSERDDVLQEAYMGLLSAIRTYDESKNAVFSTYAAHCVKNKIINLITKSNTKKSQLYKSNLSFDGDEEFNIIDDNIKNPENIVIQNEAYANLTKLINENLSSFEKDVLFLYLSGCTYSQAAQKLSSSQKSVDNALQRARKKLKEVLNNFSY